MLLSLWNHALGVPRILIRTGSNAARLCANIQATRSGPRCGAFLRLPTVFVQPKTPTITFLFRRLSAF